MRDLRLTEAEATTIMIALRALQERIEGVPTEIRDLADGELLDEHGIDDLCAKMRPLLLGRASLALRP